MVIKTRLLALLLLFVFLSIVSLSGVYSSYQLPIEKIEIVEAIKYKHVGTYDYTANLKPNIIYNQSTLKPGQGRIYLSITKNITTTFSYTFELLGLKNPANITTEYNMTAYLSTSQWSPIQFSESNSSTLEFTGTTAQFSTSYLINISSVEEMAETIQNEIGVYSSRYNLTINIVIHTVANTLNGTVDEYFTPTLAVIFRYRTGEGDYISIENLLHTDSGTLAGIPQTIYQGWVVLQRSASITFSIISFACLAITAMAYRQIKPEKKPMKREKPIDEIIAPFEEIVVDVAKEPSYEKRRVTITMKSLEDIVKVADGLEKPILHTERPSTTQDRKPTHVLYVLDGLVTYEYIISAPSIEKRSRSKTEVIQD
ncbi:MAG: DUF5305 family protein [Candidatus Bathyarchaeia archaeon]